MSRLWCCVGLSTSGTRSLTAAHGRHIQPVGRATCTTRTCIRSDSVSRHMIRTLRTALFSACGKKETQSRKENTCSESSSFILLKTALLSERTILTCGENEKIAGHEKECKQVVQIAYNRSQAQAQGYVWWIVLTFRPNSFIVNNSRKQNAKRINNSCLF